MATRWTIDPARFGGYGLEPTPRSQRQTFDVLNGLRGIAAIAVVNAHLSFYFGVLHPAMVAPVVDFFFILSGFVIVYAYEHRLIAGMRWRDFLIARIIRLHPMYLLGLVLGAIAIWTYERSPVVGSFAATFGFNLFMLPMTTAFSERNLDLFPLNFPAWSLFFELAANLIYAAIAPRLGNRVLALLVLGGFTGLVVTGLAVGTIDQGVQRLQFAGGVARVIFCFFAGVALLRQWRVRPTRLSLHPALLFVMLVVPLLFRPSGPAGWVYELAVVTIYMPAMVWLGTGSVAKGRWLSASVALGALSYPVYVIHAPVWTAARAFNGWQGNIVLHDAAPWSGLALASGLCLLSWWLDKAVDYPLRRRLSKRFLGRPTRAAAPTPAER